MQMEGQSAETKWSSGAKQDTDGPSLQSLETLRDRKHNNTKMETSAMEHCHPYPT